MVLFPTWFVDSPFHPFSPSVAHAPPPSLLHRSVGRKIHRLKLCNPTTFFANFFSTDDHPIRFKRTFHFFINSHNWVRVFTYYFFNASACFASPGIKPNFINSCAYDSRRALTWTCNCFSVVIPPVGPTSKTISLSKYSSRSSFRPIFSPNYSCIVNALSNPIVRAWS